MSIDYWNMKLSGCYIKYNLKYYKVSEFYQEDDEYYAETLGLDGGLRNIYLDDMEFFFLKEGYREIDGMVFYLRRDTGRHYKLSTYPGLYQLENSMLRKVLLHEQEYSDPEEMFLLGKNHILSPDLVSKVYNKYKSFVYYKDARIMDITYDEYTNLIYTSGYIPSLPKSLKFLEEYWDIQIPYHPVDKTPRSEESEELEEEPVPVEPETASGLAYAQIREELEAEIRLGDSVYPPGGLFGTVPRPRYTVTDDLLNEEQDETLSNS